MLDNSYLPREKKIVSKTLGGGLAAVTSELVNQLKLVLVENL